MATEFTHFDEKGDANMVDISGKSATERVAKAGATVLAAPETIALVRGGEVKKGDVLSVARLAGIMGAKRTADLIPLCHPLNLESVTVALEIDAKRNAIDITATCRLTGRTGVEMEALTAVTLAALTVYDMCKSADRTMRITNIRLLSKSGGKLNTHEAT